MGDFASAYPGLRDRGRGSCCHGCEKLKDKTAETSRELCYRLYTLCERKKRAAEALSYNALVQSWPEIMRLSREKRETKPKPGELFDMDGEEV